MCWSTRTVLTRHQDDGGEQSLHHVGDSHGDTDQHGGGDRSCARSPAPVGPLERLNAAMASSGFRVGGCRRTPWGDGVRHDP
jgi:hypothetical protein